MLGFFADNNVIKTIGLFALSGSITNWLAIHMLFEKVPGLYGSGIIPARFEDFKTGIRALVMEQFFTKDNIQRFMLQNTSTVAINFAPLIKKIDMSPTFDSLVSVIQSSSFGQMLGMVGGVKALEPMRQPFIEKMTDALTDITQTPEFNQLIQDELNQPNLPKDLHIKINQIVEQRLAELTPKMVKDIIQQMIKKHLGWLVVWGGVFGGIIGLLTTLIT